MTLIKRMLSTTPVALFVLALLLFGELQAKETTFEKRTLTIGKETLVVEIADTSHRQQLGLMYREALEKNHGMLFVFESSEPRAFWMKNTFIPLSIGFFDENRKLLEYLDMEPVKSELQTEIPSYKSKAPAKYALEVPKGWFKQKKIKIGESFSLK